MKTRWISKFARRKKCNFQNGDATKNTFSDAKNRKRENLEIHVENVGTRHRFSFWNLEILILSTRNALNFQNAHTRKKCNFQNGDASKNTISKAKFRKRKKIEIDLENVRTRQQFSLGNREIALLNVFTSKILNFKNAHPKKWRNLLTKNPKMAKSENRLRKHRDASMIFSRKSRNSSFSTFRTFFDETGKKFAIALF